MGIGNLARELPDIRLFWQAEAIFPVALYVAIVVTIDVESDRVGPFTSEDEELRSAAVALRCSWVSPDTILTIVGGLRERLAFTRGAERRWAPATLNWPFGPVPQLCR